MSLQSVVFSIEEQTFDVKNINVRLSQNKE